MLSGGWRVGRIAGVDIYVHPSLLIIAGLLILTRWAGFSDAFPWLGTGRLLGLAVVGALLFFGSILVHELAHAMMSKVRNIPVAGITLFVFGGATHTKIDSRGPADEFLVTVVGPIANALLALLFYLLRHLTVRWSLPVAVMFEDLRHVNLLVALFNLVPGFPLDGGRVLRSAAWRITGDLDRATRIAARVGQAVAVALIAWGAVSILGRSDLGALWYVFIGSILLSAATAALSETGRRRLLEGTTAGDVMSAPPPTIAPDMPLTAAMDRYLTGHDGEAFPVVEEGRLLGFVSPRTARGAPSGGTVRDALASPSAVIEAGRSEPMDQIASRLGEHGAQTVLVFDDGRLVGVIEPEDLERFFRRRT